MQGCGGRRRVVTKEWMMGIDPKPQRVWSAAITHTVTEPVIVVVMGVSGSGKTTVAVLLSAALGCQFQEGDDLHPPENVEKMHGGTPLTDTDRLPWLRKIAEEIDGWRARGESGVLTCSALKRSYRDIIIGGRSERDAGLPKRFARPHPQAYGGPARALHAGWPARQPVCDSAGTHGR